VQALVSIEMKELNITLPYPPSVNLAWRTTKQGKMYLAKQVKEYRKNVWAITFNKTKFGKSRVRLEIKMFPPDNRRRDADNICKAVLDSLQHTNVLEDDSQVQQLYIEKCEKFEGGKIEVMMREIL
jgi:crossover junction endodeoxyribonuclease RusA